MKNKLKKIYIMHHTHWDREWYETCDVFTFRLKNVFRDITNMIDDHKISKFFFDGQTAILDDLRKVVSEEEFLNISSYIHKNKIEIGPWYVLADEFLVNGESIIKNLEIGSAIAKSYGSEANIGYLPDTFGHVSQMPQILNKFGIKHALIWRGCKSSYFKNTWIGADNSSVNTFVLPLFGGYFQTFLKHKNWREELQTYVDESLEFDDSGEVLILNGADHTLTDMNVMSKIAQYCKDNEIEFEEVVMSEYISRVNQSAFINVIKGEMRNQDKIFLLPGVLSTRAYLKQWNQYLEDCLLYRMEFIHSYFDSKYNETAFLEKMWKELLLNQAHDSICGCCIDETHRDMEVRYSKMNSALMEYEATILEENYAFSFDDEQVNSFLYVTQSVPLCTSRLVQCTIDIPKNQDKGGIELIYNGIPLPFDVRNRDEMEVLYSSYVKEPSYRDIIRYKVLFSLDFNGIETKKIEIHPKHKDIEILSCQEDSIENEFYVISSAKYGFCVYDKNKKTLYEDQQIFRSSLDAGDSYNYSPPQYDTSSQATITSSSVTKTKNFSILHLKYEMMVMSGLASDRTRGSGNYENITLQTEVMLYKNDHIVHVKTDFCNTASQHRLQMGFYTSTCVEHFSDTAFDFVRRPFEKNVVKSVHKNEEHRCTQYPVLSTVVVNDLQIITQGIQEYEIDCLKQNTYCFLTLVRSIADISRRDLQYRGAGAGPGIAVEDAKCLRKFSYEYDIVYGKENHDLNEKHKLRANALTKQSYENKEEKNLFVLKSKDIVYSSMQSKEGICTLRFFNPYECEKTLNLKMYVTIESVSIHDLNGNCIKPLTITNNEIHYTMQSKEVCSIAIKWRKS